MKLNINSRRADTYQTLLAMIMNAVRNLRPIEVKLSIAYFKNHILLFASFKSLLLSGKLNYMHSGSILNFNNESGTLVLLC